MSAKRHTTGFALVEVLLIGVGLVLVVAAGYAVMKYNNKDKVAPTATQQVENGTTPDAPDIKDDSDLTAAETALDQTSVEAVASDSAELDAQTEDF
jgi:hypothetical protein